MKKTLRFEIITGIKPGYNDLKPRDKDEENIAANLWHKNAEEEFERSGIYVSAVIKRSYTVYHEKRGCPKGGERTSVIAGSAHTEDLKLWKEIVLKLGKKLKEELGQVDMSCEFWETEKYEL